MPWQSIRVSRIGYAGEFSHVGGANGGAVELASPDCFVWWRVELSNLDNLTQIRYYRTGPASYECLDVPAGTTARIGAYVRWRQSDWGAFPGALNCSVGADGCPLVSGAYVTDANGFNAVTTAAIAPVPFVAARFYPGLPAKDVRNSYGTSWVDCSQPAAVVQYDYRAPDSGVWRQHAVALSGNIGSTVVWFPNQYRRSATFVGPNAPPLGSTYAVFVAVPEYVSGTYTLQSFASLPATPVRVPPDGFLIVTLTDSVPADGQPAAPAYLSLECGP